MYSYHTVNFFYKMFLYNLYLETNCFSYNRIFSVTWMLPVAEEFLQLISWCWQPAVRSSNRCWPGSHYGLNSAICLLSYRYKIALHCQSVFSLCVDWILVRLSLNIISHQLLQCIILRLYQQSFQFNLIRTGEVFDLSLVFSCAPTPTIWVVIRGCF